MNDSRSAVVELILFGFVDVLKLLVRYASSRRLFFGVKNKANHLMLKVLFVC